MAAEHSHLLAVSTVCSTTGNFVLHYIELLCKCALQTCGVKACKSGNLAWFQTRVEQSYKTCKVGRVEDDNHMLYIWAILLDVLSQVLCNLTVASEQVFACHTSLTWSAA